MIAILGGGISGISAGYHLNVKNIENTIATNFLAKGIYLIFIETTSGAIYNTKLIVEY
jgi:glycine/D-amino acid oxidase-like deaminating enzyme